MSMSDKNIVGLLARFESASELVRAARTVKEAGYEKFDCHSPFPIHGMDQAMGLKRSALGWLVGIAALLGTSGALLLQYWTSAIEYPIVISGKPLFSYPAFVPVTFAVGVLLSAIVAAIGMLALNGLPRFHHPVFFSDSFASATDDSFFISIESDDSNFDLDGTKKMLESVGGQQIEELIQQ